MSPPTIVLHQWLISPFCAKVRKALTAKGLEFETREYNGLLAAKAKTLSKAGLLPVLDYTPPGAKTERIQDSAAILRFLERAHPSPSLWPTDPRERALAHLLEDWADKSLFWLEAYFRLLDPEANKRAAPYLGAGRPRWEGALVNLAGKWVYRRKLSALGLTNFTDAQLELLFRAHLDAVTDLLGEDRSWVVGEQQSIADVALAAQLGEFVRTSRFADEIRAQPQLLAWLERNPG